MDVRGVFDHILKKQLFLQKIGLGLDGDLVTWSSSFLIYRKIQLVIDWHNNNKKKIDIGIFQKFSLSPILFWIYINGVFNRVLEKSFLVTSFSFIDDLDFIALDSSLNEIVKALKKLQKK